MQHMMLATKKPVEVTAPLYRVPLTVNVYVIKQDGTIETVAVSINPWTEKVNVLKTRAALISGSSIETLKFDRHILDDDVYLSLYGICDSWIAHTFQAQTTGPSPPTPLPDFIPVDMKAHAHGQIYVACQDPPIYCIPEFITQLRCAEIIEVAKGSLRRSAVVDEDSKHPTRTSSSSYLKRDKLPLIYKLMSHFLKLEQTHFDPPQVAFYTPGQKYQSNHDAFDSRTALGR